MVTMVRAATAVDTGTVKGTVKQLDQPVASAVVVISSANDSSYEVSASSDEDGGFVFSAVPLGEVRLEVYDAQENLLASGTGVLEYLDQTITVDLKVGS